MSPEIQLCRREGIAPRVSAYMVQLDQPTPGDVNGRILQREAYVYVIDLKDTDLYRSGSSSLRSASVDLGGIRTGLAVPLRKDAQLLDNLCIGRLEVRPFSEKQITIAWNFA